MSAVSGISSPPGSPRPTTGPLSLAGQRIALERQMGGRGSGATSPFVDSRAPSAASGYSTFNQASFSLFKVVVYIFFKAILVISAYGVNTI